MDKIVWSYVDHAYSPYETPYTYGNETVNPWHSCGMIADGVYYTMNAEHSADEPIKRGWCMHAINMTDWRQTSGNYQAHNQAQQMVHVYSKAQYPTDT